MLIINNFNFQSQANFRSKLDKAIPKACKGENGPAMSKA